MSVSLFFSWREGEKKKEVEQGRGRNIIRDRIQRERGRRERDEENWIKGMRIRGIEKEQNGTREINNKREM